MKQLKKSWRSLENMSKVIFKPRTTAPSTTDKNYLRINQGGLNYAIAVTGVSVLPNCVGYAWGRWRELLGQFHELSRGNAEVWWGKRDGYERSQTPRLGSIICWRQGSPAVYEDGAGHVAVVEDIKEDGTIITSNSAYKGSRFYMRTLKPPYNMGGTYVLQGFIHPPVDFVMNKPQETKYKVSDLNIGDTVAFSGRVHRGSDGTGAGWTFTNRVGKITHKSAAAAFPINVDGLGWVKLNTITDHKPLVKPKPLPEEPKPDLKGLKKGDTVTFSGRVHSNSAGKDPGKTYKDRTGKITHVNKAGSHPINVDGLGWIKMEQIADSKKPAAPAKNHFDQKVQVGQKITFSYIRKTKTTNKVMRPYYRNKDDRGYGIVKKIHTDVNYNQGAYEVQLDKENTATIGFVAPINTY